MNTKRRLLLLRHAEAGPYQKTREGDMARTLTAHGRDQAHRIGCRLAGHAFASELSIVTSPAERTLKTAQIVRDTLAVAPDILTETELYMADVPAFYRLLHALPDTSPAVLLVGHNPTIGALVRELGGPALHHPDFASLQSDYPTATLSVFDVPGNWFDIRPSTVRLTGLISP